MKLSIARRVVALLVVASLVLASCASPPPETPTTQPTVVQVVPEATTEGEASGRLVALDTPTPLPTATPSPTSTPVPDPIGKAEVILPKPEKSIPSEDWGEVVVNHVLVVMSEDLTRTDAERVARELGGTVVGEIEFINLYQIETQDATEADLLATLSKAAGLPGVEIALPDARVYPAQSSCKACGPLSDPVYSEGENGRHYEMIGVQAAWDIIKVSGIPLNKVTVGVLDDALYTKSGEVGGKAAITGLGEDDTTDQPSVDDQGNLVRGGLNHGTLVTHVIAADPDNGGVVGVAGPLGDKLQVNVTNIYTAQPSFVESTPDPEDPTKVVRANGKTYVSKTFRDVLRQIKSGSKIINCSFGPKKPSWKNKSQSDAWWIFLSKMHKKYPDVLFVAAAGNEDGGLDGSNYSIGGHKLPNLITVGALDNEGNRAGFSNYAIGDGEVTISAPGVRVPMGVGPDGNTVTSSGTSYATPMVTAAAALLRSINPKLSAAEIKRILEETSAPGVIGETESVPIPSGMGKGVLRVDDAVLRVINDLRALEKKPPLIKEDLAKLASIDGSVEMRSPTEYVVTLTIPAAMPEGTKVSIKLLGEGMISGSTTKTMEAAGDVTWDVTLVKAENPPSVRLCRLDSDACCDMPLEVVDLAGRWSGALVFTDISVTTEDIVIPNPLDESAPPTVITKEECEQAWQQIKGKEFPLHLDFEPSGVDAGMVTVTLVDEEGEKPMPPTSYSFRDGRLMFDVSQTGFSLSFNGTITSGEREHTLSGSVSMAGLDEGGNVFLKASGPFTASRPKP